MKKLFILVVIMLMSVNYVASQDVLFFKAIAAEVGVESDWSDAEITDVSDEAINIVINNEKRSVKISNKFEDAFILNAMVFEEKEYSEDYESDVHHQIYEAYDKDGTECKVVISFVVDEYYFDNCDYRVGLIYNNLCYRYYCEKVDL